MSRATEIRYMFIDVLGLKLSDRSGDFMGFLCCNEWRHRVAILAGPQCLNHVAYDLLSVDCSMRGISQLKKADIDIKWRPQRRAIDAIARRPPYSVSAIRRPCADWPSRREDAVGNERPDRIECLEQIKKSRDRIAC